ncbi:hypothetical protein [Aeromicrobium marinum]|uniref:hypothetical protein n=1 Tax=Aeromicrobium marinum TaxID=219314 RepID=UPI00145DAA40|nr:hypothetical protein [Aeromicrobium marinum]
MTAGVPVGTPSEPWEFRAQVPPGYIELVHHETDDDMLALFDEMLQPHADQLSDADLGATRTQLVSARRLLSSSGLQIGGVLMTAWEGRATTWLYGVWLLHVESDVGLNPVGLVERVLGGVLGGGGSPVASLLSDVVQEDFELLGGRVGSSLYAVADTTALTPPAGLEGVDLPTSAGLVLAAVPVPELPEVAALVVGAAPTVEERGAMAVFASGIAHTAHLMPDDPQVEARPVEISILDAFGIAR